MQKYKGEKKFDMVVATDLNWAIGYNNELLTHVKQDIEFFKSITPSVVIMGRKTSDSLPKKYLSGRVNIIISRSYEDKPSTEIIDSCTSIVKLNSIDAVLKYILDNRSQYKRNNISVIGGRQIYLEFLKRDLIDRVFLTTFYKKFEADTYIPNLFTLGFEYNFKHPWHVVTNYENPTKASNNDIEFTIHTLIKK